MTGPTQHLAGIAVIILTTVTLSACNPAGGGTGPETPVVSSAPTATATVTPSPSPTRKSPKDTAAEHAEAVFRDYLRAVSRCLADPAKTKPTCFDDVAIATELTNRRNALLSAQAQESKVLGGIEIVSIKTKKVDLSKDLKASPPVVPEVVLTTCTDVSKYNIVDKDGKSIVPPSRKPRVLLDVSVLNYQYPDASQWRVGLLTEVKDGSC